ncbi:MAG: HlyD family efflux transporter periplasmic adaptor subunit [Xanthomonadales bacterium]|nr:HlyD family efflux transporter periplasmic adaptor subunit [Xanthomonadales bacterium]
MVERRGERAWMVSALCLGALLLAACAEDEGPDRVVEVVQPAPLRFTVEAEGQLRSKKAVPLLIPGDAWTQRQIVWMKDDGSSVQAGEVVARFSGAQSQLELSKSLLDLQRNALARAGKQDELDTLEGRVEVDIAQVGAELKIAQRYAGVELGMLARNEILDKIQDSEFLEQKQGVLDWRRDQAGDRGAAEAAVLDAQRTSFQVQADRRRGELDALELRAPNDGVLVLSANWSDEKPKLGATVYSGQEFASLPDPTQLEVSLHLPQQEAQGIAVGQTVFLYPLGRPEHRVESTVRWVAEAPQQRHRRDPTKYLNFKADVPAEASRELGLVPGQTFHAEVVLHSAESALSLANIAIRADGEDRFVEVLQGGSVERRAVKVGARGAARSEIVDGLQAGEVVVLASTAAAKSS